MLNNIKKGLIRIKILKHEICINNELFIKSRDIPDLIHCLTLVKKRQKNKVISEIEKEQITFAKTRKFHKISQKTISEAARDIGFIINQAHISKIENLECVPEQYTINTLNQILYNCIYSKTRNVQLITKT